MKRPARVISTPPALAVSPPEGSLGPATRSLRPPGLEPEPLAPRARISPLEQLNVSWVAQTPRRHRRAHVSARRHAGQVSRHRSPSPAIDRRVYGSPFHRSVLLADREWNDELTATDRRGGSPRQDAAFGDPRLQTSIGPETGRALDAPALRRRHRPHEDERPPLPASPEPGFHRSQ